MALEAIVNRFRQSVDELTTQGADFEVGEATLFGQSLPVYISAPQTLQDIYLRSIDYGAKTFVVYHEQRISFSGMQERAASFATALQSDFGIAKGDRVAIAMRNNPEWLIAFMAATALGAIAVPMNAWWTSEELRFGLEDSGAKVLVADRQRAERVRGYLQDLSLALIVVDADSDIPQTEMSGFDFSSLVKAHHKAQMPRAGVSADDDATILYTSGSSGKPKGVVATHRGIISSLMSWLLFGIAAEQSGQKSQSTAEAPDAVALLTIPLFHVTGCHSIFLLSLIIGRSVVMMHKWDPLEALKLIQREKVTYVNGVPTMTQELLDAAEENDCDLSTLAELASGGAARPASHVRRIAEQFKLNPVNGYGLTETNAMGAVNAGETYLQSPDSVGLPSPAVTDIRIVGESGEAVGVGERGEICIKSPANARCYWNNPDATRDAFRDGWFHTGDIGYLDHLGMLFVVDRIKDIIIRGGENISCNEVEAAIYAHGHVAEVAVFGLPDQRLGEIVAAKLYLKQGTTLSSEELLDFLKPHIAAFKMPAVIHFSKDPLPRTATDKIFKRHIAEETLLSIIGGNYPQTPVRKGRNAR